MRLLLLQPLRAAGLAGPRKGPAGLGRRLLQQQASAATAQADPLRVCVVGAGPGGFYAAKYLLKEPPTRVARVDMLEALPTPYGLVRSGVAPDHPEVKSVMSDFAQVAADPRFAFAGNVRLGADLRLADLRRRYHAVVLAYGAAGDRALGVPGEDLANVHGARTFVNWYNGHPACRDAAPDLAVDAAVVFGQGNVALDCARILSKPLDELASTDIAQHALEALRQSAIKTVYVLGRRGSAQAAFTMKELRELTKIPGVACVVDPADLAQSANAASLEEIGGQRAKKRMHELLTKIAADFPTASKAERQIRLQFFRSPVALLPDPARPDRVGAVRVEKTRLEGPANRQVAVGTGEAEELPAGLVLRSIGYKSMPVDDEPFDPRRHVVANVQGRVVADPGQPETRVPGLYCTGWLKRGPSGIVGANIVDARETVACILDDAAAHALPTPVVEDEDDGKDDVAAGIRRLVGPHTRIVTWSDVERLHAAEEARGAPLGKPREKFTSVDEMLDAIAQAQ